jgi:hypothetical protein
MWLMAPSSSWSHAHEAAARRADLLATGRRARAVVVAVEHSVDVDDVVALSQVDVQVDGSDEIRSVVQAVPPTLMALVVPGSVVDVLVGASDLIIEWSS